MAEREGEKERGSLAITCNPNCCSFKWGCVRPPAYHIQTHSVINPPHSFKHFPQICGRAGWVVLKHMFREGKLLFVFP